MPSRRYHPKSRKGCSQCKARKVKCDVKKPTCSHCIRRREKCEYVTDKQSPDPVSALVVFGNSYPSTLDSFSPTTFSSVTIPSLAWQDPFAESLQNLELLHHFSTLTYATLTSDPELQRVFQVVIPKLALSHPFLMYSIFAFAALHNAHDRTKAAWNMSSTFTQEFHSLRVQEERYRATALRYHDLALSLFRPSLARITQENANALFACAILIYMFTAAWTVQQSFDVDREQARSVPVNQPPRAADMIQGLIDMAQLARGVLAVLQTAGHDAHWIRTGSLAPILHVSLPEKIHPSNEDFLAIAANTPDEPRLANDVEKALADLSRIVKLSSESDLVKTTYLEAIVRIRRTFQTRLLNPKLPVSALHFMVLVSTDFTELLEKKESLALLIVAHYGVLLDDVNDAWWGMGMGYKLIKTISQNIEDQWRAHIVWPMSKVGLLQRGGS